jgi:pyrimidine-nucleoside phosphorylase
VRAVDVIERKRDGKELSEAEIRSFVTGMVGGSVADYQVSAFCMAVYFQGMTARETGWLTRAMMESGEILTHPGIPGPLVDKHSTGGVGDKVSLVLAPMVAACGVRVPMMSGRGLGYTGGTLDKLESIRGYRVRLTPEEADRCLADVGFVMMGQSESLVPADRTMYALRDVTGTVESVPLITASIMSKKLAEGAQALVLDVKCGSGAFMQSLDRARELARSLVGTGRSLGREVVAVITDMSTPLGRAVGNFVEVKESIACLRGGGPADLVGLTVRLGAWMLVVGGLERDLGAAEARCRHSLADGSAWERFLRNVAAQGGDPGVCEDPSRGPKARVTRAVRATRSGVVHGIHARKIGVAAFLLGAGRERAADAVLPEAGIELLKITGDEVRAGEELCVLHTDAEGRTEQPAALALEAYDLSADGPGPVRPSSLVIEELRDP